MFVLCKVHNSTNSETANSAYKRTPAFVMSRPSSLLLVLTLLLSRAAGDIGSSSRSSGSNKLPEQQDQLSAAESSPFSASISDADSASDELQRSLRFEPPLLDFGEACPVGTARAHTVTLVNQNANRSVYLTSVSGRTPTFYSSFFEAKVVPPQGNTTFNVVFLPRAHGSVATDLLIHTSFGQARFQVRGEGRECPYRLKPMVGIKAPLNATLAPEIHMYNPHGIPLQILEVYSSGGQFQLELPSGGQEGPQTLWEIPPYATKSVIRIRFHARAVGNHTAYIRIKISEQQSDADRASENVLVIPVEFEILPQHGMYAENPVLDFGHLSTTMSGNGKKLLQYKLQLRNSHSSIQHEIVDFTLRQTPGLTFESSDAMVSLEPRLVGATTTLDEVLVVRTATQGNTSQTHEFTVLIRAEVYKGSLYYDRNTTTFVTQVNVGTQLMDERTLVVRNNFEDSIAILHVNVSQNDSNIFRLRLSDEYAGAASAGRVVLPHGKILSLLHLKLLNTSAVFKTQFQIHTNVTQIEVPLVVCSGRLHVSTYGTARFTSDAPYNLELNLGAIPLAEMSHNGYIALHNKNPMPIKLSTWDFQSPQGIYFHTTFRGCLRPASLRALRNATLKLESAKFKLCTQLEEDDIAIFQVAIQSYITDHHTGTLKIWTAYEEITTTVRFRTWIGKLEVDQEQLYFRNCFPGKRCTAELSIRSTFQHPIHITSINFTDAGLYFEDFNTNGSTIAANTITKVGRIHFEPALLCQTRCYIPQDERTNSVAFPAPQNTRGGPNNNLHFDETELRRRTELFRHLKWYFQDIAFTLNSHEVRQFLLQLIIDIEWPKFVGGKQVLPTIEVGKAQEVQVLISNPADTPVLIDYFLSDPQYSKETQLSLPLEVVDIAPTCYLTDKTVFSLLNGAPRQPVLLPPRTSFPVFIRFEAQSADTYCTLLHIRNNLTLYEAVWLSTKVVQSQFRFGNRKPGSSTPLLFEMNEKHLSACGQLKGQTRLSQQDEELHMQKYPQVVTKRTFTARNTGEIPIWIETFLIGDQMCSGYGFKVVDCSSFALKANDSKKIEIAFSPDFTASRISRPLTLRTNLSYDVEYLLLAQLTANMLDQCSVMLPRPIWEERIRNAAIVLLATTFVFVLIAAHIDYGNILLNQSALYEARDKGSVHPTFNLRNIALKATQQQPNEEEQLNRQSVATSNSTMQQQRRSCTQHQSRSVCSGSVAGGNNNSNSVNSNLKKRSLKRNHNTNGNVPAARASLPWSLDLNALKSSVTSKTSGDGDKTNFVQLPNAAENSRKSTTSSIISKPVHNERGDATTILNGSASGGTAKKQQQHIQQQTSPQVVPQQPQQPQQQPRSARKSKNTIATSASTATASPATVSTSGCLQEKTDKDNQLKHSNSVKNVRGVNKSAFDLAIDPVSITKVGTSDVSVDTSPITPNSKESSGGTRTAKYGKTPGRERRKDAQHNSNNNGGLALQNDMSQSNCSSSSASCSSNSSNNNSKRSERKQRQKQSAASQVLNFGDSSITRTISPNNNADNNGIGLINCINSPWDTSSQVSFSDVLQTTLGTTVGGRVGLNVTPMSGGKTNEFNNSGGPSELPVRYGVKNKGDIEHSLFEIEFNRQQQQKPQTQTFAHGTAVGSTGESTTDKMNNASTELGPIGSKKSPSSTPVWEPLNMSNSASGVSCLPTPKPVMPSGNCSFFSNLLPGYEYESGRALRGIDADLYEMKKAQDDYFEYMYSLRQQQLQAQVQAQAQAQVQAQQQQQQQQLLHGVDWARLHSRTWSPMSAYVGPNSNGTPTPATAGNASTGNSIVTGLGSGSGNNNALPSPWQLGGGATVMRPPPGLETSFQNITNLHQVATAQQQLQQEQQQQKQQQQQQQSQQAHHQQLTQQMDGSHESTATSDMQTFDPFSSLSSIWSENWHKRSNSSSSNNNLQNNKN